MSDGSELTRRDFLKGAAATAAAVALALEMDSRRAHAQGDAISVGVIGTGVQGRILLAELTKLPGAKVIAYADVYPASRKKAGDIAGGVTAYEDHRAMLDQEKALQAVVIATPTGLHAAMAIEAMKAGKHVFCEAPMANTIEDCKAMIRAAKETGKVLAIGHQRRSSPLYKHAFAFTKTGLIGKLVQARAQNDRNQSWRKAVPDPANEQLLNWRLYQASSGGLMTEFGSHALDAINWFAKSTPLSVMGNGGIDIWQDGREVADNVQVIYEYPGGIKVAFSSTLGNSYGAAYELFEGNSGTIWLSRESKGWLFKEAEAVRRGWEELAHKERIGDDEAIVLSATATRLLKPEEVDKVRAEEAQTDWYRELQDFIACIAENKEPACTGMDGLRAVVAAAKANEAIASGTKLKFTEDLLAV